LAQTTLIQVRDLTRRDFKTNRVLLDKVFLDIDAGEQIGLVGPSGSGKSSLLRAIAMLDRCESGQLLFHGEPVCGDDVPKYRRQVIYLPQQPTLMPGTVRENFELPFRLSTAAGEFEEAAIRPLLEALSQSGQQMFHQEAEALSGGERQIVALVRALALSPQVLLLDEPTAGLDPEATGRLEQQVKSWLHDGPDSKRALVWTSHDADQVDRMTNRTIEIRGGVLTSGGEHG
jgi:putative ABC transport system ATP-binding protein